MSKRPILWCDADDPDYTEIFVYRDYPTFVKFDTDVSLQMHTSLLLTDILFSVDERRDRKTNLTET